MRHQLKLKHMKYVLSSAAIAAALLVLPNCGKTATEEGSELQANGVAVGDVRGTALINKTIRTRLLDQSAQSTFTFEIERVAGNEIYNMRRLLGQFSEGTAHTEFHGGEPNPFGLLLWHQVLSRFAEGLGRVCDAPDSPTVTFSLGGGSMQLSASYHAKLKDACKLEGDKKAVLSKLWRATVGFGAPAEEAAFVELFAADGSELLALAPKARMEAMILAMAMNPHFLLEK